MQSLERKRLHRREAERAAGVERRLAGYSRTSQVAHSSIPVGEEDWPIVEIPERVKVAQEQVETALEAAEQAAEDALKAVTTADGKNSIYAGMTEPAEDPESPFAQGDIWYVTDSSGRMTMVRIWNGTEWVGYQFVADSILVPGSVGPTLIEDGSVTTQKIAAEAIVAGKIASTAFEGGTFTGGTFTGSVFRTAASGQRLQMDSTGLRGFLGVAGGLSQETFRLWPNGDLDTYTPTKSKAMSISQGSIRFATDYNNGLVGDTVSLGWSGIRSTFDSSLVVHADTNNGTAEISAGIGNRTTSVSVNPMGVSGKVTFGADEFLSYVPSKLLWSGAYYPLDTQTASLSGLVSEQLTGIVLQWQQYTIGSGTTEARFVHTFVPKGYVANHEGRGIILGMNDWTTQIAKYVYIYNDRIGGHAHNGGASSPFGDVRSKVLTAVYGV